MNTQYCRVGKIISGIEIQSEINKDSILLSNLLDLDDAYEKDYES